MRKVNLKMTKVTLKKVEPAGWMPKHEAVAKRAIALAEGVLADDSADGFLAKVENARYSQSRFRKDDGTCVQLSPRKIAEVIRTGKERKTEPDNTINLQVRLKAYAICVPNDCKMGYVLPPDPIITTNLNWINKQVEGSPGGMDPVSVGAHWLHEWMHVAGFRHKDRRKIDREDAPYRVATLFKEAAKDLARLQARTVGEEFSEAWGDAYEEAVDLMIATGTDEFPDDVVPADDVALEECKPEV